MLLRLLRLLPLCCFCLAMLLPDGTEGNWSVTEDNWSVTEDNSGDAENNSSGTEDNSRFTGPVGPDDSSDPLTVWPGVSRSGALSFPPTGRPGISGISPTSESVICDMLLNQPVPPPIDQIPFFCICSRCKGTPGPKGDRGDRGPPGK